MAVLSIAGCLAFVGPVPATTAPGADPERLAERVETGEREALYIVINHEEQYSVWPAAVDKPAGGWVAISDPVGLRTAVRRAAEGGEQMYKVVINHEEQYSIWPLKRETPKGFRTLAPRGEREGCELKVCAERIERHDRRDG